VLSFATVSTDGVSICRLCWWCLVRSIGVSKVDVDVMLCLFVFALLFIALK
jgi:hypothetical protein